jgi:hypothetical protein
MDNPKEKQMSLPLMMADQVLLLVDWDNLFSGLLHRFDKKVEEMRLAYRLEKMMEWIGKEVGQLLGGCGFVFAPEHLTLFHQEMCVRNKLRLIVCPKRQLKAPKLDRKKGKIVREEDTVDETIIWYANMMAGHPHFKTICLAAGDNDYAPLFEEMGRRGIRRALSPPTDNSLAKTGELVSLVDRNPITHKKMLFVLDKL